LVFIGLAFFRQMNLPKCFPSFFVCRTDSSDKYFGAKIQAAVSTCAPGQNPKDSSRSLYTAMAKYGPVSSSMKRKLHCGSPAELTMVVENALLIAELKPKPRHEI
jgi:hypothetical protein